MKLYLSSYHLGEPATDYAKLFGENKQVALITNALDFATDLERKKKSIQADIDDLSEIGLQPEEFDLREYFGDSNNLRKDLDTFSAVFLRGGNAFVLRRAMRQSGLDQIIDSYRSRNDFIYSGYSAGVCVATPTLKGVEKVDDPTIVPEGYDDEIIWDGLGLIDYCIAPHYKSDHPETKLVDDMVDYYRNTKTKFRTLSNGEAIIVK